MSNPIGLYLHVPFCDAKCPYCDFYSMRGSTEDWERYTESIISHLYDYQDRNLAVDSVYFGGGTPSLLGAERLGRMLEAVRGAFALSPEAEITVEVNPTREPGRFFEGLAEAGVTRVSIGLQSAQAAELRALGRRHTAEQAAHAVALAHRAGIANVSLDLMLAVPGQTVESLRESVRFCAQAGVTHVSAYLLKIEPGTAFYARRETLPLPDEDGTCDLYLEACAELEACGFAQYEISTFALPVFGRLGIVKWYPLQMPDVDMLRRDFRYPIRRHPGEPHLITVLEIKHNFFKIFQNMYRKFLLMFFYCLWILVLFSF